MLYTMVYTRICQPGARRKYAYTPGSTLLFRLTGTVIPLVWQMCVCTAAVTYLACVIYDPLRRGKKMEDLDSWQKLLLNIFKDMERILQYFTGFITFILGFFNSIVFNRWWHMRELCGNIVEAQQNAAIHVAVFFVKEPPEAKDGAAALRAARRDLVRLLALGQALALQACHRVRDHGWLIERGLLQRGSEEHLVLQGLTSPGYNEVFGWYIAKAYAYMEDGMVDIGLFSSVLHSQRWALLSASNNAEDLMMHLNQQVPLAYTHLLELMTKLYVLITPLALVPSLLWIAIPIAPIVTLFFYGFFQLGTSMLMDPFQKDSGFDTDALLAASILSMESLEQNVPLSRARSLADAVEGELPPLSAAFLAKASEAVAAPSAPSSSEPPSSPSSALAGSAAAVSRLRARTRPAAAAAE